MNLLETLLNANNGALVGQLARSVGVDDATARTAVQHLLPALSRGLSRNAARPGGSDALLSALKSGTHAQYFDDPGQLGSRETVADGNAILGHILGSKDVSRNIAGHAAQETGLDQGILKQMLPMVAAMAMGALSKQVASRPGAASGLGQGGESSLGALLTSFLDADKDGSVVDDLLGLAKKFF